MKIGSRNFGYLVALVIAFSALSPQVLGCSCAPPILYRSGVSLDQVRKEKRDYFLNEYKGAAFIGKILKRESVQLNWATATETGEPVSLEYFRYTIRVSDYWFGVDSKSIVVYGEPSEVKNRNQGLTSCGFKLQEGKIYFFTPSLYENNLKIRLCDFAGGGSDPSGYRAQEFRKIMGVPKRF